MASHLRATSRPPVLLAVGHGTRNPAGLAELRRLVELVAASLPGVPVRLGWLERAEPSFAEVLAGVDGPVIVVPLLLSTGYHVKVDIAATAGSRPDTVVTRQLGPDEQLTRAVLQRLLVGGRPTGDVALVAAGSSDPQAVEQLTEVAGQLQRQLRASENSSTVTVHPRLLSSGAGWADGLPAECSAANYLLAPGQFNDELQRRWQLGFEGQFVAAPIGAHPLVARVVLDRYASGVRALGG